MILFQSMILCQLSIDFYFTAMPVSTDEGSSTDLIPIIAGVVAGVVIIILIIVIIVLYVRVKKKRKQRAVTPVKPARNGDVEHGGEML